MENRRSRNRNPQNIHRSRNYRGNGDHDYNNESYDYPQSENRRFGSNPQRYNSEYDYGYNPENTRRQDEDYYQRSRGYQRDPENERNNDYNIPTYDEYDEGYYSGYGENGNRWYGSNWQNDNNRRGFSSRTGEAPRRESRTSGGRSSSQNYRRRPYNPSLELSQENESDYYSPSYDNSYRRHSGEQW